MGRHGGRAKDEKKRSENMRKIAKEAIAKGLTKKRFTPVEVAHQMQLIGDAWVEGASDRDIFRMMEEAFNAGRIDHKISRRRVTILRERIQRQTHEETEGERPFSKARQARRITRALRDCKGVRNAAGVWTSKPDHMARSRYEDMIARIEGNYEPIKIEVDAVHRQAVAEVLSNLSEEELQRYAIAFDRMQHLAESKAQELGETLTDILPRIPPSSNGAPPPPTPGLPKTNGSHKPV